MKTIHSIRPRQTGLTLVEILVAMVISLILMAGVLQIFQANKQTSVVQESLSLIQENGRTAMRILTEELRIADFWGCGSQNTPVEDNLNSAGTGYVDLLINGGIFGTNGTGTGITPDSITIEGARSSGINVSTDMTGQADDIRISSGAGLQQGDIMLVTDCVQGDIIQITNANPDSDGTIEHNSGNSVNPGNSTANLSRPYDTTAMVFQARQTTYSIDNWDGEPFLFRTEGGVPVELVEGIEDLQIEYGERLNASGDMRYVPADAAGLNMDQVLSVRITLIARSTATNVTAAGDGRLRRTFTNTISIRNRNP